MNPGIHSKVVNKSQNLARRGLILVSADLDRRFGRLTDLAHRNLNLLKGHSIQLAIRSYCRDIGRFWGHIGAAKGRSKSRL